MEAGLWSLGTLALTALGFVAYNHPRAYRLYFSNLVMGAYGLGILSVALYNKFVQKEEVDFRQVVTWAGILVAVGFYLAMLDDLEGMGISKEKREPSRQKKLRK